MFTFLSLGTPPLTLLYIYRLSGKRMKSCSSIRGKLCKWHCYWPGHSVYSILMLVGLFSNLTEVRCFCEWVSNSPIRHRLIWLIDTAAINVQNSLLIIKKWHHSFPKGLKQTDCGATPREAKFHKIPNQRRLDHRPTLRTGLCLPCHQKRWPTSGAELEKWLPMPFFKLSVLIFCKYAHKPCFLRFAVKFTCLILCRLKRWSNMILMVFHVI